jgi:hypothetical protein
VPVVINWSNYDVAGAHLEDKFRYLSDRLYFRGAMLLRVKFVVDLIDFGLGLHVRERRQFMPSNGNKAVCKKFFRVSRVSGPNAPSAA